MRSELAMIVLANACALPAYATPVTTIDWGLHDPIELVVIQPKGNVDDFILFAVEDATGVRSAAVSKDIGKSKESKGGTVYLFQDIGDVLVGSYEFGGGTVGVNHEFDLQPGDYYYRIVGRGPGASGSAYTLTSSLRAELALVEADPAQVNGVPEPQSYALALSGLIALGWSTRRRWP